MVVLFALVACAPAGREADPAAASRWSRREAWGSGGLSLAWEGERAWVVDAAGAVRSGPFLRATPAEGGFGRGWVAEAKFQLLDTDGGPLVAEAFTAVEPFDAADRAFAALGPASWGLLTRDGLWLEVPVNRWHGPGRLGDLPVYAFGNTTEHELVDADGVTVNLPAALATMCAGQPVRAAAPATCTSVEGWAGAPRAFAEAVSPEGALTTRWYCGGVRVRVQDGAALWTLPGFDSAAARALAVSCGEHTADTRVRPVEGGAELRLGPAPS